jgi:hypothetical protein
VVVELGGVEVAHTFLIAERHQHTISLGADFLDKWNPEWRYALLKRRGVEGSVPQVIGVSLGVSVPRLVSISSSFVKPLVTIGNVGGPLPREVGVPKPKVVGSPPEEEVGMPKRWVTEPNVEGSPPRSNMEVGMLKPTVEDSLPVLEVGVSKQMPVFQVMEKLLPMVKGCVIPRGKSQVVTVTLPGRLRNEKQV